MANRLPKAVRLQLTEIQDMATFTGAAFDKPGAWGNSGWEAYTDEVRKATSVFRNSWIIDPIQEILDWDERKIDTGKFTYQSYYC